MDPGGDAPSLVPTRLTRAQARWYLLRFGGPLAVVPSLLQPIVVVATAVVLAAFVRNPFPLLAPIAWLALPIWLARGTSLAVDKTDEPDLHALVASVARELGAPLPHQISLDASPNASFRRNRATRRTELRIGVPLLVALDGDALAAVTAHELAHGLQGRRRFGAADLEARLVQTRQVIVSALASGRRRRRSLWPGSPLAHFLAATQPLARALETSADQAAMAVVGSEAMASALRSADRADAALALYHGFVVSPLIAGGTRPSQILDGFTRWTTQADERILDRLSGWHDADADSELDDHPHDDERTTDAPSADAVSRAVSRHPSAHLSAPDALQLHSRAGAERLLAGALLGRHRSLPTASGDGSGDDSAITSWRLGATSTRLRFVRSGRRGRRVPALSDVAARLTMAGAVPTESAQLVNLLVSLSVAFAVELGDRGWIGPLPGTSTLISPADTFDDAIALAMQAIEEHSGVVPLVDALRAGRPRMASA